MTIANITKYFSFTSRGAITRSELPFELPVGDEGTSTTRTSTTHPYAGHPEKGNMFFGHGFCPLRLSEIGAEGQKVQKSKLVTFFLL